MFNEFFERAISAVNATHSFNSRLSESLAPLRSTPSPNNFDQIVVPIKKVLFSGSVAGVDSGFVSKKLSFIDLVLVKTAGVVFDCEKGSLVKSTYYPAPFSFPEPMILRAGLEKDEEQQSISLLRLEKEVSCATEMIKKFKPEFMFIDGSIVPQYQDKPRKESGVNEDYVSIIHSFQKLYKTAEENSCNLVACVEDSRGTRFRQLLAEEIIPKSKLKISASSLNGAFDASILDYYLRPSERTFVFPYTKEPESHAILKDYSKDWSESIFVFYLKASEYDKPLRVEFVCKNQKNLAELSEKISSLIFSLSSLHKEYSFPSILIEADLRAGLSEQEISVVYERLVDRLGTKIRMRRGNRPFG